MLKTTKTRMTDRTNLLATIRACSGWSLICLINVLSKVSREELNYLFFRSVIRVTREISFEFLN